MHMHNAGGLWNREGMEGRWFARLSAWQPGPVPDGYTADVVALNVSSVESGGEIPLAFSAVGL